MAATQKKEVEQMRLVLEELSTHPEARLFYALQERGTCSSASDPDMPRLTLRSITDKVNRYLYPNLTAFVEDMTMIFSSCPSNTPLASGAASLRELFTDLLAKYTDEMDVEATPPGKKKRLPNSSPLIDILDEDETGLFAIVDSDDDFGDISLEDSFTGEILHSSDRAALLELTEEIASIEAEIQQLKDTKEDLHIDSSLPGFASHSVLDALKSPSPYLSFGAFYSSGAEEGRVALSPQRNKKRPRRNSTANLKVDDDWTQGRPKRRAVNNRTKELQEFQHELMTKEQLLSTITNDLPPKFLEGVIRIVNPTYNPATATDEDLEFDINLLDDEVLARLQQYVNTILRAPSPPKRKATTRPKVKKETPKRRLQKEAPKKVNRRRTGSRKKSSYTQKPKKQQQQALLAATLTKRPFVSAEHMKQIFMKEEIVRASKSLDNEDEEVDILD